MKRTEYRLGEVRAIYITNRDVTSFTVVPETSVRSVKADKLDQSCFSNRYTVLQSPCMVQLALRGDGLDGDYTPGHTYRNAESARLLRLCGQQMREWDGGREIVSVLEDGRGIRAVHRVAQTAGSPVLEMSVEIENNTSDDIVIENLASFTLDALSPFARGNDADRIYLHKIRSDWSSEGRLVSDPLSVLQLEDTWTYTGTRLEKIAQVGSLPARRYFPFMAVEDKRYGVVWAALLQEPASWQLEAAHTNGWLSLSGGIADYTTGHFAKRLKPGQSFRTQPAFVTAVKGDLDCACARLVERQAAGKIFLPQEAGLPVLYNEYCTSWGNPSMQSIGRLVPCSRALGAEYFVMDTGWYKKQESKWQKVGDWIPCPTRFPQGLRAVSDTVTRQGMRAGIWFEFEGISQGAENYLRLQSLLLTRHGSVIRCGDHSFLDFRKEESLTFLRDTVVRTIEQGNFGYIKIDYNESIGVGCDGGDSLGDGLRAHIACVQAFFVELKRRFPDLVIELCASGGLRSTPAWLQVADMVSFSDAHETDAGAIVAANLHRLVPPRMLQIWSCVNAAQTPAQTVFSLAKSFLGRMCLSGDILELSDAQQALVRRAVRFYRACVPLIRDGETRQLKNTFKSYARPRGVLAVLRTDREYAMLALFSFGQKKSVRIESKSLCDYRLVDCFSETDAQVTLDAGSATFAHPIDGCSHAAVLLLEKAKG